MKITIEGQKNMEHKLCDLRNRLRALENEKALAYTATGDTWHDNPYFDMLRLDENTLVKEITEIEEILRTSEVLEMPAAGECTINIGVKVKCRVEYSFDEEQQEVTLEIVGHGEADSSKGKIAYDSPVGKNLIGHTAGDTVKFDVPAGAVIYHIISII